MLSENGGHFNIIMAAFKAGMDAVQNSELEDHWHGAHCVGRTYQVVHDSGSVTKGDLVTHFPDADEYWITRGNGSEKVRKITAEEFNVVRMEWLQKATRQE